MVPWRRGRPRSWAAPSTTNQDAPGRACRRPPHPAWLLGIHVRHQAEGHHHVSPGRHASVCTAGGSAAPLPCFRRSEFGRRGHAQGVHLPPRTPEFRSLVLPLEGVASQVPAVQRPPRCSLLTPAASERWFPPAGGPPCAVRRPGRELPSLSRAQTGRIQKVRRGHKENPVRRGGGCGRHNAAIDGVFAVSLAVAKSITCVSDLIPTTARGDGPSSFAWFPDKEASREGDLITCPEYLPCSWNQYHDVWTEGEAGLN